MGTPEFAVPALRALIAGECEIAAVFTRPDRPSGRGRHLHPSPVKQVALEAGIEVFEPLRPSSPEWVDNLTGIAPDLLVTAAYGHILRKPLLDVPRLDCINVHASLLPRHRGASPIAAAILAGDSRTGVTIIRMSTRMDEGDIIAQEAIDIADDDTAGSLHDKLAELAAGLLLETVAAFRHGSVVYTIQKHVDATYCRKLTKADGEIDWNTAPEALCRHIRAMTPWPAAYTVVKDRRISILQADACENEPSGPPGTIMKMDRDGILVAAAGGCIVVRRLKPAAGRAMSAAEFLNGHPVRPGDCFGTVG